MGARSVPLKAGWSMGRPRKSDTARRSAPVLVKLTIAERDRLAAEVARLRAPSLTALVRERALTGTVTVRETQELAGVDRIALNRVGVNLNQIARMLNEQGAPAIVELADELRASLARLNLLLLRGTADGAEPL